MIVTISGWLYIVGAVGILLQFRSGHGFGENLASLLGFVLSLAVGVGLLKRLNWARWIAIGVSLLSWTVGSLVFLWFLFICFRIFSRARSVPFTGVILFLFLAALFAGMLWLSKRLFDHLTSIEGEDEFNAPESEQNVVVKSTLAYIAYIVLIGFLVTPRWAWRSEDLNMSDVQAALKEATLRAAQARRETANRDTMRPSLSVEIQQPKPVPPPMDQAGLAAQRYQEQVDARAAERLAMERRQSEQQGPERKLRELSERRKRDRSYTEAQFDADVQKLRRVSAHEERAPTQILKCRDSSGSISYTQGYCPNGTQLLESRATE